MLIVLSFTTETEKTKFEYIYHKYKKLLLFKAYGVLKDYSLSEDAVSEAFIRIYKNLYKIEDVDSNQTISFLVTIVKNTSITLLKKAGKNTVSEELAAAGEDGFDLEEVVISESNAEAIFQIIGKLKEDLRAPFLLKYAHDLSHKEIGKILSITENNVTVRIHRAKNKLAALLREEGYINEA